jgi:uncharacterized membrane protein
MQSDDTMKAEVQAVRAGERVPAVRRVGFDAPWGWLAAGWRDLCSAPFVSLTYGAVFSALAYGFAFVLFELDRAPVILPLAGGFLLLAPLLAVGLYEISRRIAAGEKVGLTDALAAPMRARGQLAFMGVILLLIYLLWVRLAFLLFMLFFGPVPIPPVEQFVPVLLFSTAGIGLLVTGTVAGAALATAVFAISAISIPMLLDREVDTVSAMLASLRAVGKNPAAMMLWAALIVALTAVGVAALFIGLAVVFPLIGHATWHAYKDLTAD